MRKSKFLSLILAVIMIASIINPMNTKTASAWYPVGHESSITSSTAYASITSAYSKVLICTAAKLADSASLSYNASSNISMHGGTTFGTITSKSGTNYVIGLMYLYHTAYLFKNNTTTTDTTDMICNQAKADIEATTTVTVAAEYVAAAKGIVNEYFTLAAPYNSYSQDTNMVRAFKVLGFATHLAGDIFAHRTIVPIASISSNLFTESLFNTGLQASDINIQTYCYHEGLNSNLASTVSNWKSFCRGVNLYYMEFKDIKFFAPNTSTNYEDNVNFYASRYSAAKYSVNYLISKFKNNTAYIDSACLLPGANGISYSLKSNNLKSFYSEAGLTWVSSYDAYSTADLK